MILFGYGLELRPLVEEMLEQLRNWRNAEAIRTQMEYREYITAEMQQSWFRKISINSEFAYFIIYSGGLPVGMIHLSHINTKTKTAEAGLFVAEERYTGTGFVLGASMLLLEYAFDKLGMDKIWAKVKIGNEPAEKYNGLLGFMPLPDAQNGFRRWELEKAQFITRQKNLRLLMGFNEDSTQV